MQKEKKFHYVYLTTNLIDKQQYIGDRSCNCDPEEDRYLGSGRYYRKAEHKHGKKNFKKEILECFETRKEAFDAQEKYIIEYNTLVPNGYNISPKGGLNVRGCHSEETKKKISVSNKEKHYGKRSEESKRKQSLTIKGHSVSKETREKISKGKKGKPCPHNDEWNNKISLGKIGFKHSEKTKEKMRGSFRKNLLLKKQIV